ncbi:peptidase C13 [Perkinsus sp. BL_2016]|nr:peptidase C13 [Perkinsus sp. BL_2016]
MFVRVSLISIFVSPCFAENHAVLIDTSRLWTNYRHSSNTLAFYNVLRDLGFSDDRVTVFMTGDVPCSFCSPDAGTVFHTRGQDLYTSLYSDVKGDEISREGIMRLLKGKHPPMTPRNRRMGSSEISRLFVFMTGHSGIGFAKIQDLEEFSASDIADTIHEMSQLGRYSHFVWFADTCRAASLHEAFYSPNLMAVGSSANRQSSYSRHGDNQLGVSIVDRFSYNAEDIFNRTIRNSHNRSLAIEEFSSMFDRHMLMSDISVRTDLADPDSSYRLIDFLASAMTIHESSWKTERYESEYGKNEWREDVSVASRLMSHGNIEYVVDLVHKNSESFSMKLNHVCSSLLFILLVFLVYLLP